MQHTSDVIENSFCKKLEYIFSHSEIILSIANYQISLLIIPYYSLACFCRCGMMHGSIHQMISHVWRYGLMERKAILMITLQNWKLNNWWGNSIQELKERAVFSQISSWQQSLWLYLYDSEMRVSLVLILVQGSSHIVEPLRTGMTQGNYKKCTYKRLSFLTLDLQNSKN